MQTIVVVGGSAAGMAAAAKAKRTNPDLNIIVFEKSKYVSYAPCGIPYYFEGLVKSKDNLVYYTPEYFREKRKIDVRNRHLVTDIDASETTVKAVNLNTNEETKIHYDKLVLTTGGEPVKPKIEGIDLKGLYTLRLLEEADSLYEALQRSNIVGVVGAGYIGLELTEAFVETGKKVILFEMLDHVMRDMDKEITKPIEKEIENHGVDLHLNEAVKTFEGKNKVEKIITEKGNYPIDLVLLAAGVKPNTYFAEKLSLELGITKAIKVDGCLKTSNPDIYAAGDNVETVHLVTGKPTYAPLAPAANKMGRIAGENVAGGKRKFPGVVGTAITKFFNLHIGRTGLTLTEAQKAGFAAVAIDITHGTRSHYYPGNQKINIRLVADRKTHLILGGQIVGPEGVAGRINTLAVAITNHMTVEQLGGLDLGYAPPFAPVWDPLIVAANVLQSKLF